MPSLQRTNFYKAEKARQPYCMWRCEKQEGRQLRDSCCLTFAARLPSILYFLQNPQAFFFSLSLSDFFLLPLPSFFLPVLSYSRYCLRADWQKWNFFSEEECWTCQKDIKNGRGNWKRKDVHEILRVIAAARCNVRSVTVIAFECVRARAGASIHVSTSICLFIRSHVKKWRPIAKIDCSLMTLFQFLLMNQSVFPIAWMVILDKSLYFKDKIGTLESFFLISQQYGEGFSN